MSTYHSDRTDDGYKAYVIIEQDRARRKSDEIARVVIEDPETDEWEEVVAALYDNMDSERSGNQYRYEYTVIKVVGLNEREKSRTTYTVDQIESMNRDEVDDFDPDDFHHYEEDDFNF